MQVPLHASVRCKAGWTVVILMGKQSKSMRMGPKALAIIGLSLDHHDTAKTIHPSTVSNCKMVLARKR